MFFFPWYPDKGNPLSSYHSHLCLYRAISPRFLLSVSVCSLEFESWSCHLLGVTFTGITPLLPPTYLPTRLPLLHASIHPATPHPTHPSIHPSIPSSFHFFICFSAHPPVNSLSPYICAFIYPPSQTTWKTQIHMWFSSMAQTLLLSLPFHEID